MATFDKVPLLLALVGVVNGLLELPANQRFRCEKGWAPYHLDTCLIPIEKNLTYFKSRSYCDDIGARLVTNLTQEKEAFIFDNLHFLTSNYWMGLFKNYGNYRTFQWKTEDGDYDPEYQNWRSRRRSSVWSDSACAYLDIPNKAWGYTVRCYDDSLPFICQKKQTCIYFLFGAKCDQHCHCHGIPCDHVHGTCKYGCERGWFGERCDKEKLPPKVGFHCFNTTSDGAYVLLHVDPLGVSYADLDLLGEDSMAVPGCSKHSFTFDNDTHVYSRVVSVNDSNPCGGKLIAPNKWQLRVRLREYSGVLSENDVVTVVSCDFADADDLVQSGLQSLKGNMAMDVKVVKETKEDVTLAVIDPFHQEEVKETELGTSVKLILDLVLGKESSVVAVSGYSCEAFTYDNVYNVQLTDQFGCQVPGSIMPAMRSDNESWLMSGIFPMFTFPGYSSVNFRCHYEYCFKMEELCMDRCEFYSNSTRHSRLKRDVTDEVEVIDETEGKVGKPVYTTVRIVDTDKKDEQEDRLHGLPLLYLNPITCSLFLFLLSVFLLHYVFFIKNLKNSVEEMKKELRLQNRHGVALL